MEVRYGTRLLQRCAESLSEATRRWGPKVGAKYQQRLAIIESASSMEDVAAVRSLRMHPLRGDRSGTFALDLTEQWRLIIRPAEDDVVIIEEVTNHYE